METTAGAWLTAASLLSLCTHFPNRVLGSIRLHIPVRLRGKAAKGAILGKGPKGPKGNPKDHELRESKLGITEDRWPRQRTYIVT